MALLIIIPTFSMTNCRNLCLLSQQCWVFQVYNSGPLRENTLARGQRKVMIDVWVFHTPHVQRSSNKKRSHHLGKDVWLWSSAGGRAAITLRRNVIDTQMIHLGTLGTPMLNFDGKWQFSGNQPQSEKYIVASPRLPEVLSEDKGNLEWVVKEKDNESLLWHSDQPQLQGL